MENLEYRFVRENNGRMYGTQELKIFTRITSLRAVNQGVRLEAIFKHVLKELQDGKLDEVDNNEQATSTDQRDLLQKLNDLKEQQDNLMEYVKKIKSRMKETQILTLINNQKITRIAKVQGIALKNEQEYATMAQNYLEKLHGKQQ